MKQLRERLYAYGSETLLTEELLAIILRGSPREHVLELASRLLVKYGGLGGLLHADCRELSQEQGLGEASIALIKAALEMGKRLYMLPAGDKYQIAASADVARLVMPDMAHLDHEQLRVIVLDTKNRVVSNMPLYRGTVNSSVLRAAEIFRPAITRNCPGIIVCHNHPTGLPEPSHEDVEVTNQLVAAGKVLDIELVDHLIIGHQQFVSMKERLRW